VGGAASKRERKEARRREVIREGQEYWSPVEGFLAGLFFYVFRVLAFDLDLGFVSLIAKGLMALTGLIVLILLLNKFSYGSWIPVKFLASFVLSYALLRILFTGSVF
jgi:hypothetical protein